MGIVNAKLLSDNLSRIADLAEDFSPETIASAIRDKTGDASVSPSDVSSFLKLGAIGSTKMLVSAKQAKKLRGYAQAETAAALQGIVAPPTEITKPKVTSQDKSCVKTLA